MADSPNSPGLSVAEDDVGYDSGSEQTGSEYSGARGDANDSGLVSSPDVSRAAGRKIKSDKHRQKLEQRTQLQQQKKQQKPPKGLSKKKEKEESKQKLRLESAKSSFTGHHVKFFGPTRWPGLLASLQKPTRYCALINRYCDPTFVSESLAPLKDELTQLPFLSLPCLAVKPTSPLASQETPFPQPKKDEAGVANYYLLDAASLLAVELLNLQPTDTVLDLCAAPGGKSLAILQSLRLDKGGSLVCNELSPDRRKRLKTVITNHVPHHLRPYVTVSSRDATKWHLLESAKFDKILVDAPCSSDRHLLHDTEELASWTPMRVRNNAKRQFAILASAVKAAREGGVVVYATCALSEAENDAVVQKVIDKTRAKISILRKQLNIGEATKLGWIVLPDSVEKVGEAKDAADGAKPPQTSADLFGGWGPLYFAVLRVDGFPELAEGRNRRGKGAADGDDDGEESDDESDGESGDDLDRPPLSPSGRPRVRDPLDLPSDG